MRALLAAWRLAGLAGLANIRERAGRGGLTLGRPQRKRQALLSPSGSLTALPQSQCVRPDAGRGGGQHGANRRIFLKNNFLRVRFTTKFEKSYIFGKSHFFTSFSTKIRAGRARGDGVQRSERRAPYRIHVWEREELAEGHVVSLRPSGCDAGFDSKDRNRMPKRVDVHSGRVPLPHQASPASQGRRPAAPVPTVYLPRRGGSRRGPNPGRRGLKSGSGKSVADTVRSSLLLASAPWPSRGRLQQRQLVRSIPHHSSRRSARPA